MIVNTPGASENIIKYKLKYNHLRNYHRKLLRIFKAKRSVKRDTCLYTNPSQVNKSIRTAKRRKAGKIPKLTVGHRTYNGDSVKDGFFDSISQLKSRDEESLSNCRYFEEFSCDTTTF